MEIAKTSTLTPSTPLVHEHFSNAPVIPSPGFMATPGGQSDEVRVVADGILWVTTPSHGGFLLSPNRLYQMPERYRSCSWTRDQFVEEDCSRCAVVLAFPNLFSEADRGAAEKTYALYYAK
jgi:hypothetical protein